MPRAPHTLGPLVCYHGCDKAVADAVLSGNGHLRPSSNDYDWLGPGTYFWVDSPRRGFDWAQERAARAGSRIKTPAVVGAYVHLGLCLNLTDLEVVDEIRYAYQLLESMLSSNDVPMPQNTAHKHGVSLNRKLDCAVFKLIHQLRDENKQPPYDTVFGVFDEGAAAYPGAAFRERTHMQIAVCNPDCILGYFRPSGY